MVDTDRDFRTALLVPVYNGAKYLEQFHRSVLQLETKFNDVVFYNDGSTDDSYSLIKDLGYKILNGTGNQGCAFARNQLIRSTDAEWVHFHDIDDLICPDYLTFKLQAVKYNYDAIFCDADWLDTNTGNVMLRWRYNNDELRKKGASYFLINPVGGINGLYKRDTLIKIGGFD
jgi:glycosyltransferase involved in cell wall biosynthesis